MICHYCGHEEVEPKVCPACGSRYISGFKAGTQKVEQMVRQRFPSARVLRMDMDTTRGKDGHEQILSAFANREADILIGTQMIVKGHDFPAVTLVGVLAADMSLHIGDYHGAERTFQLLTQAAGRAGRGDLAGEVVIQTYDPEHYSIQTACSQDYEAFYEQEIEYRQMMRYPPVWNMLVILCASPSETHVGEAADLLAQVIDTCQNALGSAARLNRIGPADASVAKVNDIYKKVIYLKAEDYQTLVRIKDRLEQYTRGDRAFRDVSIQFDFNPVSGF
jgi:primosomal protein N' (replication factor Y)